MGRERGLIGAAVRCIRRAVLRDVASDLSSRLNYVRSHVLYDWVCMCSRRSLTARLIGICIIIYIHTYTCMCLQSVGENKKEREGGEKTKNKKRSKGDSAMTPSSVFSVLLALWPNSVREWRLESWFRLCFWEALFLSQLSRYSNRQLVTLPAARPQISDSYEYIIHIAQYISSSDAGSHLAFFVAIVTIHIEPQSWNWIELFIIGASRTIINAQQLV